MGEYVFQLDDEAKPYFSGLIFVVSLVLICSSYLSGKVLPIGRAGISVIGSTLMIVLNIVPPKEINNVINWDTLILLMSMMMLSNYMEKAKIWELSNRLLLYKCKTPMEFLVRVCVICAVMASILTNDTVCVTITPIIVQLCKQLHLPLLPFLLAIATSSNIGSSALPVGNPQNMIISTTSNLRFFNFFKVSIVSAILGMAINIGLLLLYYRKELSNYSITGKKKQQPLNEDEQVDIEEIEKNYKEVIELNELHADEDTLEIETTNNINNGETIGDAILVSSANPYTDDNQFLSLSSSSKVLEKKQNLKPTLENLKNVGEMLYFYRPLVVLVLVLVGFFVGFHMGFTVLFGVCILMFLDRKDIKDLIHSVDWELLIFFSGLFVIVDGFDREFSRYAWKVLEKWVPISNHDSHLKTFIFIIIVAVSCNILGNVPLVLSLCPRFLEESVGDFTWLLLAFVSTVAGNLTLVGSVANLIVAEKAKFDYQIGFYEYLRFGLPSTILVIAIATPFIILIS
ncbi:arsenite transport subunit B [Tieghemostelium lacteum]|uniref:Arsenite transport subunit B n=1 Tax=Tieghemostelium lacteum TaxID=361077 RepID=A0A151ZEC9_TIELA|nr:arsenite transport subunit B [Tieghemostelium lacteum]|eukprot:KYQ92244.1 arsenite transport subunit B [Tieghemostelium lacteum]